MKHFYPLVFVFVLMLSSLTMKASHVIGGEMSYVCVGSEYYHVYLTFYKDCSNPAGATFDNPSVVGVFNSSGVLLQTIYLFANPNDISAVPIVNNSPCYTPAQAPALCMQQAVYDSILFLPSIPGGYTLTYQRCCRNSTIINLQNPSTTGTTLTSKIPPNSLAPNNSSPSFDVGPAIVVCTGEGLNLDFSATDPDGDVIVYELANPYLGASWATPQPNPPTAPPYTSVSWAAGYSAIDPVDANPNLSINSATGILTGTPTGVGTYVICVIAKEYRSGNYLNETRRDYQINFMICDPGTDASMPVNSGLPPVNGNFIFYSSCGNPTVSFTNTSSNANSYAWYFGDGGSSTAFEPTHTYFTTGTFTVTLIANPGYSCVDTFTAAVVIDPPLIADFDFDNVCADSAVVFDNQSFCGYGNIQSYAWTFGDSETSNQVSPTHDYTAPGNYSVTLTITNVLGCTDVITQTVTVYPRPIANFTWGSACINSPVSFTNTSTVLNIGGSVINSWYWTFDGGSPSFLQNPSFTFGSSGNYTVNLIVTTNHGCKDTVSKTVFVNALPVVTVNPTSVTICAGQSTTLNASGANTYSWLPSGSLNTPSGPTVIATPAVTTTYIVTGINTSTGCSNSATVIVTVIPIPVISISPANPQICILQSVTLTASGAGAGGSYSWIPAIGLDTTAGSVVIANPMVTTTYTVSGTNAITGCVGTQTITVTVNPLPNINVSASVNPICFGDNSILTATGANTYTWAPSGSLSSNVGAIVTANPTTTTIYTITGTNSSNGCIDTTYFTLTVNQLPILISTPDTSICIGTSGILNVTGAVSYQWLPNQWIINANTANPTVTPPNQITYTVSGTDANGCVNTDQTTVSLLALPVVTALQDTFICIGDSAQLGASSPTGIFFQWSPTTGISNPNISNPMATPSDTLVYTVTTTDVNGCQQSDDMEIIVLHPILNPVFTTTAAICIGDSVQGFAFGGLDVLWSPAIGIDDPTSNTPWFNPATTTSYTVTVSNFCFNGSGSFTVVVNPLPVANADSDQDICEGQLIQLNGSGGTQYQWTPSATLSDPAIANPTSNTNVTATFSLLVTDNNGCQDTDDMTVNIFYYPVFDLGADVTICEGSNYQLQAYGGNFYSWTPSSFLSNPSIANPVATPPDTISYTVSVYDLPGCETTDDITINVPHPFVNNPFPDQMICEGAYVQLIATDGYYYEWQPLTDIVNPNYPDPFVNPLVTTTYTVTISNDCFTLYDTITVVVNPLPTISAGADVSIHRTETVQLNVTGGVEYYWLPSDGLNFNNIPDPVSSPFNTITYFITGIDANGCVGSDTITVNVDVLNLLVIPTAFTPNGDGVNDVVRVIKMLNIEKILDFKIYNRLGNLVFASNELDAAWDGKYDGDPQPLGTYTFYLQAQTLDGELIFKHGNITLIR